METLAYLQLSQEQESSEGKELSLDGLKFSGKLTGTLLSAAGAAFAVSVATSAPAQAYHYDDGCYDYGCGGYDVGYDHGCYDYGCGGYDVGYDYGCYDYGCGGGYPVSYGYDECYDYGCGGYDVGYDHGCYDYGCGGYPVSYDYGCYDYGCGHDIGYDHGCYDYGCGGGYEVSYDYGCYDPCEPVHPVSTCDDYCGVSFGYNVYDIQVALNYAGFPVAVDGVFGPQTESAIRAFQAHCGLIPDGIVGPATARALGLY